MKIFLFKRGIIPLMLALLTAGSASAQLTPACSPSYPYGSYSWYITNVNINGFNHSPSYSVHDYTGQTLTLDAGTLYTANITSALVRCGDSRRFK